MAENRAEKPKDFAAEPTPDLQGPGISVFELIMHVAKSSAAGFSVLALQTFTVIQSRRQQFIKNKHIYFLAGPELQAHTYNLYIHPSSPSTLRR